MNKDKKVIYSIDNIRGSYVATIKSINKHKKQASIAIEGIWKFPYPGISATIQYETFYGEFIGPKYWHTIKPYRKGDTIICDWNKLSEYRGPASIDYQESLLKSMKTLYDQLTEAVVRYIDHQRYIDYQNNDINEDNEDKFFFPYANSEHLHRAVQALRKRIELIKPGYFPHLNIGINSTIGGRMLTAREKANISIEEAAAEFMISEYELEDIETDFTDPNIETIGIASILYRIPAVQLILGTEFSEDTNM